MVGHIWYTVRNLALTEGDLFGRISILNRFVSVSQTISLMSSSRSRQKPFLAGVSRDDGVAIISMLCSSSSLSMFVWRRSINTFISPILIIKSVLELSYRKCCRPTKIWTAKIRLMKSAVCMGWRWATILPLSIESHWQYFWPHAANAWMLRSSGLSPDYMHRRLSSKWY